MDTTIAELARATEWDDYVGQHRLKGHLEIKIGAAVAEERLLDHTLLVAPPGAGKTTLAELIAHQLGDPFVRLVMPMSLDAFLYEVAGLIAGIVFLDELHAAPPAFQEKLQLGLNDGYIPGRWGERVDTRHVTFIGATTTEYRSKLLDPLVERFKYKPAWEPYGIGDMTEIVAGMSRRVGVDIPPEVCAGLAKAAGGIPRRAQDLIAAARDLAAIGRAVTVDDVLDLAGLDADGLTRDHLDYLHVLETVGGMAGLPLLTSMLGRTSRSVEDLERVLVLNGLIRRTPQGRKLMPPGRAKLHRGGSSAEPRVRHRVPA